MNWHRSIYFWPESARHKILNHCTDNILKSQLLLDEDLERILNISQYEEGDADNILFSKEIYFCVATLISGVYILKNVDAKVLGMAFILPSIGYATGQLCRLCKDKVYQTTIDKLLIDLKGLFNLNRDILTYLQKREENVPSKVNDNMNVINSQMKTFLDILILEELDILHLLNQGIGDLRRSLLEFDFDQAYLDNISEAELSKSENMKLCITNIQRIQSFLLLICSNFLLCIYLVCSKQIIKTDFETISDVMDTIIPNTVKKLSSSLNLLKHGYMKIRMPQKLISIENIVKNKPKYVEHHLKKILMDSSLNINFTIEKYQRLIEALGKSNGIDHMMELEVVVIELKEETLRTYETLENLEKLFNAVMKKTKSKETNKVVEIKESEEDNSKQNTDISSPNFVDYNSELSADEEFEAYVDCTRELFPSYIHEWNQTTENVQNFVGEIAQDLRTNQQFLARKKRFGVLLPPVPLLMTGNLSGEKKKSCTGSAIDTDTVPPVPPPIPASSTGVYEEIDSDSQQPTHTVPPVPPPIPASSTGVYEDIGSDSQQPTLPPLSVNSSTFGNEESHSSSSLSQGLLNAIKTRGQDKSKEDIFEF